MPGCDTGRNVQKYRGGGGGASTLQEALENGNISTLAIELQSSGLFIGDGGGLSNIAGVGGSVGNMQQVTTSGASTSNKIILTNTNESLQASGNVTVNSGKFFLGDGGLLSNTAGTVTLQQASNQGNVINNIVSFTNAAESIVTTGNVIVSTNVHASEFFGDGTTLTGIALSADMTSNAARVTSLESSVTTNTGDITSLETDMTSNAARVSSLETDMTSNASRITTTETDVTSNASRITSLETDMTSNASRITSLETDVTSNASRVSSLETDMTSNASRITVTETDMTSNAARVSSLESSVTTNTGDITSLETDMTSNASRVSSLETDMTSNASRITTTETDVTSNAARVSSLESSVTTNTSDITSLETDMTSNASRVSSLETDMTSNASRVSSLESETQPVNRGGTGNTFSSASKSDLLVGTSGGTFATLSIPASSATDKILKIDGSNNLYWGPDNTSSGGGGGGSGVLSLGSTFMKYASGVDYNTSTGRTINLEASTNDLASNIVVRDTNKNINVTKVTLGSNTLTETEYSGKSSKVNVTNNNDNSARNIPFLNSSNDEIVKDQNSRLTWTPQANKITIGPSSGTSNTLTNTTWSGKSDKVTIDTNNSTGARPVLFNEGDAVFKDDGNKFNWTPNSGTLTIGTIGGTHSNITSTTFTGTATKVAIGTAGDSASKSIIFETGTNTIGKDTNAGFTYNPSTEVIQIGSSSPATLSSTEYSGTAAKVTVTNESNPSSDSTARAIPYLNGTILKSVAGTLKYKPDDGTLTAAKFSGDGSGLSGLSPSALSGAVGSALGGTGQTGYTAGDILYASNDTTPVLVKLAVDNGKFLKSTSSGVEWSPVSASTVPVTTETSQNAEHGLVFVSTDDASSQALEKDMTTLKYNPSIGTLTTSNLITSDTSTNARNGIANDNPTSTLSVGTVVSIQETSTGDVLIVRGNGYFNDDVYIAKKLTLPSGSVLVADTIRVRSHNVKETLVVAERPASQVSV